MKDTTEIYFNALIFSQKL